LIKATVSAESFGLEEAALDLSFQYSLNPWRCQRRSVSGWTSDVRLLPGPNGSCQEHQEHPIGLLEDRSFDLPPKDNELLPEEGVFGHEFGRVSGKVSHGSQQERGGSWFCPVDEVVLDRLEAHVCQSFEEGEQAMHSV
jgi:hypothetical protein